MKCTLHMLLRVNLRVNLRLHYLVCSARLDQSW